MVHAARNLNMNMNRKMQRLQLKSVDSGMRQILPTHHRFIDEIITNKFSPNDKFQRAIMIINVECCRVCTIYAKSVRRSDGDIERKLLFSISKGTKTNFSAVIN